MIVYRDGPDVDPAQLRSLLHSVGFNRSNDLDYLRAMVEGSRWVVSAWEGPALVGFGRAVSDGVANAYITTVAVDPAHQRQGIATEMMRRLIEGKPTVKFVLHATAAGERLYRKLGFVDAPGMFIRDRTSPG